MADKLDKSLDQIITSNKQRGGKVGGGRGGVRGKSVQARVARGGRVGANTNIKRGAQGRQFNNRTQQNVQGIYYFLFLLYYFILFYFILFYFILFYFVFVFF